MWLCSLVSPKDSRSWAWRWRRAHTCHVPLRLSTVKGRPDLFDLRPVRATIRRGGAVHLGDVEANRALVIHSLVRSERHRGTSSNGNGGSAGTRRAANVASEVFRAEVRYGAVVVCVPANVLILRTLGTIGGKVLEDVCTVLGWLFRWHWRAGTPRTYSDPAQPLRGLRGGELQRQKTSWLRSESIDSKK